MDVTENARLYRDLAEREARVRRLIDSKVVGVNALQHPFDRRLDTRVVFENPKGFVRPVKFARGGRPAETARVTQALGFGEIGLTAAQPVFSLLGSSMSTDKPYH